MSNIAQKVYKYESLNKLNKSKQKKKPNAPTNKPHNPKPLPEWNATINDVDKYKLSSAEIVKINFLIFLSLNKNYLFNLSMITLKI